MATARHYHNHYHFSYNTSFKKHFSTTAFVALILIVVFLWLFRFIGPRHLLTPTQLSIQSLLVSTGLTLVRLAIAYAFAIVFSIPLALWITAGKRSEKFLLPFFDILQSIPVLAFFPVIVLTFIKINFFDGAAIFVLFMAMLWNLVFSMVGGLKTIPQDIQDAAFVFKAKRTKKLFNITLPAVFPYLVTGSLLAWAQGWNIIIVAEVLHNYIPNGTSSQDLQGLGSVLVNASYQGNNIMFISALVVMIVIIGLLNFFVWQKLLSYGQKYKFE